MNPSESTDYEKQAALYEVQCLRQDASRIGTVSIICFVLSVLLFVACVPLDGLRLLCSIGASVTFTLGMFFGLLSQLIHLRAALAKLAQK